MWFEDIRSSLLCSLYRSMKTESSSVLWQYQRTALTIVDRFVTTGSFNINLVGFLHSAWVLVLLVGFQQCFHSLKRGQWRRISAHNTNSMTWFFWWWIHMTCFRWLHGFDMIWTEGNLKSLHLSNHSSQLVHTRRGRCCAHRRWCQWNITCRTWRSWCWGHTRQLDEAIGIAISGRVTVRNLDHSEPFWELPKWKELDSKVYL